MDSIFGLKNVRFSIWHLVGKIEDELREMFQVECSGKIHLINAPTIFQFRRNEIFWCDVPSTQSTNTHTTEAVSDGRSKSQTIQ